MKFNQFLFIYSLHVTSLGKNLKLVERVCRNATGYFFFNLFFFDVRLK